MDRIRRRFDPRAVLPHVAVAPHAFAFADDPAPPPSGGGAPSGDDSDRTFTQAQIDEIVSKRLERERAKASSDLQARLDALGISSLDELAQQRKEAAEAEAQRRTEAEAAERERLAKEKKWEELREFDRKKHEEQLAGALAERDRLAAERDALVTSRRQAEVQRALLAAASDAVAPEQVAALLAGQLDVDEAGRVRVLDAEGNPRTDGTGGDMTPQQLVTEFLEKNPHFARAAGGRGAGGTPSGGGAPGGADAYEGMPAHRRGDIGYMQQHKDQILADARAGKIQL